MGYKINPITAQVTINSENTNIDLNLCDELDRR